MEGFVVNVSGDGVGSVVVNDDVDGDGGVVETLKSPLVCPLIFFEISALSSNVFRSILYERKMKNININNLIN